MDATAEVSLTGRCCVIAQQPESESSVPCVGRPFSKKELGVKPMRSEHYPLGSSDG
jgi:hypothetical protein